MWDTIIHTYEDILGFIAKITVHTLELIGIIIILVGSVKAIIQVLHLIKNNKNTSVFLNLGKSLALALEFKMGAEIVNTVIVRDLRELGILAIIIVLRAILAFLIHWEIKNEQKESSSSSNKKEC